MKWDEIRTGMFTLKTALIKEDLPEPRYGLRKVSI